MGKDPPNASIHVRRAQYIVVALVTLVAITDLLIGLHLVNAKLHGMLAVIVGWTNMTLVGGALLTSSIASLIWRRWRALQMKFFFVATFFFFMLITTEATARVVGYVPAPLHPSRTYWTADSELGFVCR